MSDPRIPEQVLAEVAAARGALQLARRAVEDLRRCARGADRAIEDAEAHTARARMVPDDVRAAGYLAQAADQLGVLSQRCARGSRLAAEIEERLETATGHLQAARGRLDGDQPDGVDRPGQTDAVDLAALRTSVDDLAGTIGLAAPLAQAARTHLRAAGQVAAQLTGSPTTGPDHRHSAAWQVEQGVQDAARSVARAEEASLHLDRALGHAGTGAARTLADADRLEHAARERRHAAEHRTVPFSGSPAPPGPSR